MSGSLGGKGMKRFDIDGLGEKLLRKFAGNSSRRSFLTKLATQGVTARVLQELAGHKNLATTQRYIDVNDDMKRSALLLI